MGSGRQLPCGGEWADAWRRGIMRTVTGALTLTYRSLVSDRPNLLMASISVSTPPIHSVLVEALVREGMHAWTSSKSVVLNAESKP